MAEITGDDGNNDIAGDDDGQTIAGGGGDDKLRGGDGDDGISGGQGNDQISGGKGDDIVYGGKGDDILNGGQGNDRAVYNGDVEEYMIFVDSNGRLHINDLVLDRDGNDTLKNFEEYNFNGTIYSFDDLFGLVG